MVVKTSGAARVRGIDLLRGLCILAVVIHHINLRIGFHHSAFARLHPAFTDVLVWNGYYGVRIFFVISGFLIAGWSLKRWGRLAQISGRQFYLMRFARIVPCLAALLVLLSILDRAGVPRFVINTQHTSLARALLAAGTFHINWLEARTGYLPAAWDVLWSLSVEEVFYIFFPLLCMWTRKTWVLVSLLGAFIVIGPFARVLLHGLWSEYGYLASMDGIALGCLAAIVANITFSPRTNLAMRISGTLLCLLIMVFRGTAANLGFYQVGLDITILNTGTALLVIAFQQKFESSAVAISRPLQQSLWSKMIELVAAPVRWFGRNTYEVYLTHMLVIWPMFWAYNRLHQTFTTAPLWFIGITVLTGVLGYFVAQFYSEPMNRMLRTKLSSPRTRAAAVQANS